MIRHWHVLQLKVCKLIAILICLIIGVRLKLHLLISIDLMDIAARTNQLHLLVQFLKLLYLSEYHWLIQLGHTELRHSVLPRLLNHYLRGDTCD